MTLKDPNDKSKRDGSGKGRKRPKLPPIMSRREWLARLGEGAASFGLGYAAWNSERVRIRASELAAPTPRTLPPGLYQPSVDCLTQVLESAGRYHRNPEGAETDYVRPRSGPYAPQFFTRAEFRTVRRLVLEMVGPPERKAADKMRMGSETLSETYEEIVEWIDLTVAQSASVRAAARNLSAQHRNLAVHYYGAVAVRKVETANPEDAWRAGLKWLAAESARRYGRPLSRLRKQDLRQLLESISDSRPMSSGQKEGKEFFMLLKAEVIRGYYTSQQGLRELDYKGNSFYAVSPGCTENGKTRVVSLARNVK